MEHSLSPYKPSKAATIYAAATGLVVWFALILQVSISIPAYMKVNNSLLNAIIQILSFFTIQSNLMVGVCLWTLLLKPSNALYRFFSREYVLGGICLYIIVVGLVYNIILRNLWHPTGLFKLADDLLHSVNPLLFVIYWLIFARQEKLKWTQSLNWLWFPFLYLIYTVIRGAIINYYPYPFINVDKLGYSQVLINSLILLIVFLVLGLLLVAVNRIFKTRTGPPS
ncbi:Pr6Pr family membrane protein [Mucilaginibacter sp. NFX135]|uniref:Pr6Pr family membrane protein n=1 Tax=Mucilaginibacter sp. NFX135 TaxID=3402687 RepID=UPI003AFAEAA5